MDGDRSEHALARIEAALARLESAAAAVRVPAATIDTDDDDSDAALAALNARHERLRAAVNQSIHQLDTLITGPRD